VVGFSVDMKRGCLGVSLCLEYMTSSYLQREGAGIRNGVMVSDEWRDERCFEVKFWEDTRRRRHLSALTLAQIFQIASRRRPHIYLHPFSIKLLVPTLK
jgi:hypothetical protein